MKDEKGFPRIKLPAKATMWYLAISLVGKGVGFICTPVLTRLLSGEEYGKFSFYITLVGGISVVCSAISSGSAIYKGLRDYGDQGSSFLRGVLIVNSVFSLLICLLLFTFHSVLNVNPVIFLPITLQILCDGIVATALTSAKFYYKYKDVAIICLSSSVLPPIISILFLKSVGGGYLARVYPLLFVSIALAIYSLSLLIKSDRGVDKQTLSYVIRKSAPLLPHSLSSALSGQADKFILCSLMGTAALGKYTVVFSLGVALQFIITSLGSAVNPWILRKLDSGGREIIPRLLTPMFLGLCALSLCVVAVSPEALLILAPKNYFDAFPALLPLALSCPFYFISTVITVGLIYSGKGKFSVILSSVSAVLCIILNYTLIGGFGYLGAGLSALLCRVIEAILGIYLLQKSKCGAYVSIKSIALISLATWTVGVAIYMAKDLLLVRMILLIIPASLLIYCLAVAKHLVFERDTKITP